MIKRPRSDVRLNPLSTVRRRKFLLDYVTYMQMSPEYNPADEGRWEVDGGALELLHRYNDHEQWYAPAIEMPIFLVYARWGQLEHEDMQYWQDTTARFSDLWQESQFPKLLREKFRRAVEASVPTKKIVCGGFVAMYVAKEGEHKGKYAVNSLFDPLQYLAALIMAEAINAAYDKDENVQIILQGPMYTDLDLKIWLQYHNNLKIVDYPQGFLEIGENTLVMTNCLYTVVPLLQICADLLPEGPAGFICNTPDLDSKKQWYAITNRVTPKVAKLLRERYDCSNFDDHALEQELWKEARQGRYYWFW